MTEQNGHSESWSPCAPGDLAGLVTTLKRRRTRQQLQRRGGIAATLLVAVSTGLFALPEARQPVEFDYGGITCTEVRQMLPEFQQGTVPKDVSLRIDAHLALCPTCQQCVRDMMPSDSRQVSSHHGHTRHQGPPGRRLFALPSPTRLAAR